MIQIRNVPEQTSRTLKARAASRGESLNTYLLELLRREAAQPTVEEVLARAARRTWRVPASSADLIREMRADRGREVQD